MTDIQQLTKDVEIAEKQFEFAETIGQVKAAAYQLLAARIRLNEYLKGVRHEHQYS
jgi:hypothetical protein